MNLNFWIRIGYWIWKKQNKKRCSRLIMPFLSWKSFGSGLTLHLKMKFFLIDVCIGLCWNSHVGHLEARQQYYAAVCGLLLSERHHHSLRPGVRLTPEFILLHFPGAFAICSLSLPWCQIMHCVWIFCEATVGDELLLKIIWMHLRKQVCLLNFRADFFYLNMMYLIYM